MPNHIRTDIVTSPEVVEQITRQPTAEERDSAWSELPDRVMDFNLVVPEPANMFHGGCDMNHPHVVDGVEMVCWYEWNRNAWGTKWNAYETEIEPIEGDLCRLRFQTAWAHPVPVMEKLVNMFPNEVFYVQYADEDLGSNLGAYVVHANGASQQLELNDEGVLDQSVVDALLDDSKIDVRRCIDIAAPIPYSRNRTEEQNQRATDWARWVRYRETPEQAKLQEDAWELAYDEYTNKPEEEQEALRGTGWIGNREKEIMKELAQQRGIALKEDA